MLDQQWTNHSAELYRKAEMLQAEAARRRAAPSKPGHVTMARLGKALSRLGDALQERYADNTASEIIKKQPALQQN